MDSIKKREQKIENSIEELKNLEESAESQTDIVINGTSYPASHTWREIAKLALNIADQQEWFERNDM